MERTYCNFFFHHRFLDAQIQGDGSEGVFPTAVQRV